MKMEKNKEREKKGCQARGKVEEYMWLTPEGRERRKKGGNGEK